MTTAPYFEFGQRFLVYVDVLGWTELVRSLRGEDVARKIFAGTAHLQAALEMEIERRKDFDGAKLPWGKSIRVSYFSDTIVYSCAPDPDDAAWVIVQVQRLCTALLAKGHYTRGAVTVGELLHDETALVGRALVDAYEIDRSVAKYPRLVVTDEAVPLVAGPRVRGQDPLGPPQYRMDSDGLMFLDIFQIAGDGTRSQRANKLAKEARLAVQADILRTVGPAGHVNYPLTLNHRAKYAWMLAHLDRVLADPVSPTLVG